jgi:hypothetical protein
VWTAIRKGSGLVADERTDLRRGANNDDIGTDVRRREEKITMIVNVNDQKDTQSRERPARKLNWQSVVQQGRTVLAGNFNDHSSQWYPRCSAQRDTALWEVVIDENGLEIGNDGRPTHFWTRADHEGESVIDLTLANRPIMKWSILADVHATGSDHDINEWEVEADR